MAQNKRPGNLTDLSPEIQAELIRITEEDQQQNPSNQQNSQLIQALTNTTNAISSLMQSLGITAMQLKGGVEGNYKTAFDGMNNASDKLDKAVEALSSADTDKNHQEMIAGLDKLSHEIQLKLTDVEKAAQKGDLKPNIKVDSPKVDVKVDPPNLKPLEKLMNEKLPALAKQLADAIPEVPETDLTTVEKTLKDIQNATEATANRKIPIPQFPTTIKAVNADGSAIGGGTQYTDGSTAVTHPIGTQQVFVNGSNVETAVSSANPLPVSASVAPVSDNTPASQNITARDIASATATGANTQAIITGTPTAGSAATFAVASRETILVMVSGTWTGTLTSEGSFDGGITWVSKAVKQIGTAYTSNGFTANFAGAVNVAGLTNYRIRSTAAWTGTATTLITLSTNAHSVYTANNTKLEDGTVQSITNTIKPASTAPVATDTSLVVAMSPNSIATTLNAELPDITGTFTNATQTTAIQATGLNGYDNVFVSINGTYTTATATFQGSDDGGATWKNIAVAARTDSQTIESGYTNLSNIGRGWNINIQGFDAFQVLSSAVATGTVNVRISPESAPTNAGATVGANITDGTNTANVVAGDTGFNGLATTSGTKTYAFTTSSAGAQNLIANTPSEGFSWAIIQFTSVGSGLTFASQWSSSSGGTYASGTIGASNGAMTASSITSPATTVFYNAAVEGNFFQFAISALTSGTVTGTVTLTNKNFYTAFMSAFQSGTWTVGSNSATGSAVPANAFYNGMRDSSGNLVGTQSMGGAGNAALSLNNPLATGQYIYNGANADAVRSATAASNTTGTGLLGVGNLMFDGTNHQLMQNATGASASASGLSKQLAVGSYAYNGGTADYMRNNTTGVVIAAGATASNAGVTTTTYNASKAVIVVNVTAITGTLTVTINAITASGYSYPILVSTAIATTGTTPLRIGEGLTASANAVANDILPRTIQVVTAVTGTISYGVDYELSV